MPFDSTEQRLDTHNAHGTENQKQDGSTQQQQSPIKRESHEAELREAFFKADFKAGSPAERLERMSKAANDLTLERQELAAAKQKEEDADFWKAEHSDNSSSGEKDTAIKPAPKQESSKTDEVKARPASADSKADMQEQKAIKAADNMPKDEPKAENKAEAKIDNKSAADAPAPKAMEAPAKIPAKDNDDDHSSEMPSERRSKLDLPASSSSSSLSRVPLVHRPQADEREQDWSTAGEEHQLNHTLAKRKLWHAKHGRERDDPDNHTNGNRPTLAEEMASHLERITGSTDSTTSAKRSVPTATHVPATLELHSKQIDRRADIAPTSTAGISAKLSDAKQSIGSKLSGAKDAVSHQLEAAEDKLAHWKDEAAEKLQLAKGKALDIKDDAASKAQELRKDANDKYTGLRDDASSKKNELSRDISTKKSEISRDIDTKRAELSRKGNEIERDVRARSAKLRDDAESASSTLRAKAHIISEDVKSEINFDIAAVKKKMNEIGNTIAHKKNDIAHDMSSEKEADISRSISSYSSSTDLQPVRKEINRQISRDIVSESESDLTSRRIAPIAVESRQKPAGLLEKVSSWWSGGKSEEHIALPTHRWSRDPDAKDMSAKLEELRASEGRSNAAGIRSQINGKWQHLKADVKSAKADIIEHDWVNQADKASAHDIDNAPSSPRSWASSTTTSPRSPASPIQRSASPVAYRSASPVAAAASPISVQQETGFFGGFDPTIMDAAVEPW